MNDPVNDDDDGENDPIYDGKKGIDEDATSESEDENSTRNQYLERAIHGPTEGVDFRIEETLNEYGDIVRRRQIRMTDEEWSAYDKKLEHSILNDERYKYQQQRYITGLEDRIIRWEAEALEAKEERKKHPAAAKDPDAGIQGVVDFKKVDKQGPTFIMHPAAENDKRGMYVKQTDGSFINVRNSSDLAVPALKSDGTRRRYKLNSTRYNFTLPVYEATTATKQKERETKEAKKTKKAKLDDSTAAPNANAIGQDDAEPMAPTDDEASWVGF